MASIVAELRKLVSPELISEVSRQTHEPDDALAKAYDAAIPAFAASIANRGDDQGFMHQLVDLASTTSADPDPIKSAMRLASSPALATPSVMNGWLTSLFGQNLWDVANSLGRYAGIRQSSASSLLLTCAPIVLGYLGRLIRTHNLSASDLAERMRRERPQIASALPAGFEMPGIVRTPFETTRAVVDETRPRERHERWSVPLAALLAALGIAALFWWARTPSTHQEQARTKVEQTTPNAVGTKGTFNQPQARALHEPPNFGFPAGSSEDRLASYLASSGTGSMNVNLDRVSFESGSARLTSDSQRQVKNIATVLRTYPKATVVVAGHTDNAGSDSANLALSRARAETIAWELRNAGVAADRIRVEAYGSQKPVADNATEEGRAQNRRVTLDVTR
jgi:outer membrane protein OmpA-like peptidoglycan-associated protein